MITSSNAKSAVLIVSPVSVEQQPAKDSSTNPLSLNSLTLLLLPNLYTFHHFCILTLVWGGWMEKSSKTCMFLRDSFVTQWFWVLGTDSKSGEVISVFSVVEQMLRGGKCVLLFVNLGHSAGMQILYSGEELGT